MLKIENTEVVGWEAAIREVHNAMGSYEESDSERKYESWHDMSGGHLEIGPNDFALIRHLRDFDADYRKFLRTITVYVDITAPLYWWMGFDVPTAGMATNLHGITSKIEDKEFTLEDFSCEYLDQTAFTQRESQTLKKVIDDLNYYREYYMTLAKQHVCGSDKRANEVWWQMIQLLPSSYNQKRTIMLNYEVLANMYKSRKNHKLDEWHTLCDWIKTLPYSELITGEDE